MRSLLPFLLICACWVEGARGAVIVTYEAPGVQDTTATALNPSGNGTYDREIERFTNRTTNQTAPFSRTYDDGVSSLGTVTTTTITWSGVNTAGADDLQIRVADQYGGAGGSGRYLFGDANHNGSTTGGSASYYRITTENSLGGDMKYFGFWWSAVDQNNNIVEFLNNGVSVATFNGNSMPALLPSAYDGNPNSNFLGQNGSEPYVFMNFFFTDASVFDEIRITANGTHFESDNHTFMREFTGITGTPVPEPHLAGALGLALAGAMIWRWRRRRPKPEASGT